MQVTCQIYLEVSSDRVAEIVLQLRIEHFLLQSFVQCRSEVVIYELRYLLFDIAGSYGRNGFIKGLVHSIKVIIRQFYIAAFQI